MKQALRIPVLIILTLFGLSSVYHIASQPSALFLHGRERTSSSATISTSPPRLHFLLPATHATPEFCKTLLTALVHGYEPTVINWGRKEKGGEARQIKIRGVHDYITNNITSASTSEELVFMIDAFDVWLQQPPSVLISKFLDSPSRVLIGADKRCWPPSPNPRECHDIPHSTLPSHIFGPQSDTGAELPHDHTYYLNRPRYPNSGTILSPARLLLPLYDSLLHQSQTRDKNLGDQQMFLSTYHSDTNDLDPLSRTRVAPGLGSTLRPDFESDLFQTATYSERDLVFMRGETFLDHPGAEVVKGAKERLVKNKITGTTPAVLHFNGGEKKLLKSWWPEMWWVRGGDGEERERREVREWVKRVVRRGGVTVAKTGEWVGWAEMGCEREGGEEGGVWGELIL